MSRDKVLFCLCLLLLATGFGLKLYGVHIGAYRFVWQDAPAKHVSVPEK